MITLIFGLALLPAAGRASDAPVVTPQGPQMTEVASGTSSVMTFQAWKRLRLEEARMGLERVTFAAQITETSAGRSQGPERSPGIDRVATVPKSRSQKPVGRNDGRSDSRLEQARLNLEIAQDLTVNDYLQIYLSQFRSREALLDVARRMAPEDVVDVLLSYQKLSTAGEIAEHTISPAPRLLPRSL